jgi:hypothetical protein
MLTFVEENHTYYWNGERVPNVTRVIASLTDYSRIDAEVLARAQAEGIAIHRMVDLDCKNNLGAVADWMKGRFEAWNKFKADTGFECVASEKQMYHHLLGYAGTADLFCFLPKLRKLRGLANIDVKRSLYAGPAIGLQTAGYAALWDRQPDEALKVKHRGSLVLNDNGTYRLNFYEDVEDWTAFLACLQQLRWREKHYGCS